MMVGLIGWNTPNLIASGIYKGIAKSRDRLAFYASHFPSVEIDSSFYALPDLDWVSNWLSVTPGGFKFVLKCPALFSFHPLKGEWLPAPFRPTDRHQGMSIEWYHVSREARRELWAQFKTCLDFLAQSDRLAYLFVLLPQNLKFSSRLWEYLSRLHEQVAPYPLALEVRNPYWLDSPIIERIAQQCKKYDIALVSADSPSYAWHRDQRFYDTASWGTVIRLLGRRVKPDYHRYSDEELHWWAQRIQQTQKPAYVYFGNHTRDYSWHNALKMMELLGMNYGSHQLTLDMNTAPH